MPTEMFDSLLLQFCSMFPAGSFFSYPFNVKAMLAILMISLTCGSVGSLVVGNRMAFFSDALAHCAFTGVALGLILGVLSGAEEENVSLIIYVFMIGFGIFMGLSIAFVRDNTSQANDTVIGVFFAGALGFAAVFLKAFTVRRYYPPEDFLFGSIMSISSLDIFVLVALVIVTGTVLAWIYNPLIFSSFSSSLALSRNIQVRLLSYTFIVLLALIVNICLKIVGVLLINALLIVPAATAAQLCKNMRQLFPCSILLCIISGLAGQWISWSLPIYHPDSPSEPSYLGESGTIVVLAVLFYFLAMMYKAWVQPGSQHRPEINTPTIEPV